MGNPENVKTHMNKYTQEEIDKAISEVIVRNSFKWSKEMMNEINSPTAEELVEELE